MEAVPPFLLLLGALPPGSLFAGSSATSELDSIVDAPGFLFGKVDVAFCVGLSPSRKKGMKGERSSSLSVAFNTHPLIFQKKNGIEKGVPQSLCVLRHFARICHRFLSTVLRFDKLPAAARARPPPLALLFVLEPPEQLAGGGGRGSQSGSMGRLASRSSLMGWCSFILHAVATLATVNTHRRPCHGRLRASNSSPHSSSSPTVEILSCYIIT